jgi:hypothetical protein
MIDFEKYMIVEEGLFGKLAEIRWIEEKSKPMIAKIKAMEPEAVAKLAIKAIKSSMISGPLNKQDFQLAKGSDAEQLIRTEYYKNIGHPGVIYKMENKIINVDGVPVLLNTKITKSGEKEIFSLEYPCVLNGALIEDVLTPPMIAKVMVQGNVSI